MKIRRIQLSQKSGEPVSGAEQDLCLYFFRSPVTFVSDGAERAFGGSVVVICDGDRQSFRGRSGRGLLFDAVSFRMNTADRQYLSSMNVPMNTPIELPDDFVISNALRSLKLQWDQAVSRRSELADIYMRLIFIELESIRNAKTSTGQRHIPKYRQLKQLRDAIYSDPVSERSVDEVCGWLDISRSYFHRLYTAAFGVTFSQDVIACRLDYAAELLTTTDMSVSAVAEQCGYESDAYFMRQFRQHRGCTPTEYRRKIKDEK